MAFVEVRPAHEHDKPLLRQFHCVSPNAPDITDVSLVSEFICGGTSRAYRRSAMIPDDRFLLAFVDGDLAACGYHEAGVLPYVNPPPPLSAPVLDLTLLEFGVEPVIVLARFIRCLAVATAWQGRAVQIGETGPTLRMSDLMMIALVDDVRLYRPEAKVIGGMVHRENTPSIKLCERLGWTLYADPKDEDYLYALTLP